MTVFGSYAKYYDLLYKDKGYSKEAEFVISLIRQYVPNAKSFLELGCGSGGHAEPLARQGFHITGIDFSEDMLSMARGRLEKMPDEIAQCMAFEYGDIRDLDIGAKFDAVLSLFHVVSYQVTNSDLQAVFNVARSHLKPGGVFIFDFWHGPGVLNEQPKVRVKRLYDKDFSVVRIAEPQLHTNQNTVDVNYQIIVDNLKNNRCESFHEQHRMRYLFLPEIELLLNGVGLSIAEFGKWMSRELPDLETWAAYCVARF